MPQNGIELAHLEPATDADTALTSLVATHGVDVDLLMTSARGPATSSAPNLPSCTDQNCLELEDDHVHTTDLHLGPDGPSEDLTSIPADPVTPTVSEHISADLVDHFRNTLHFSHDSRTDRSLDGWSPHLSITYGPLGLLNREAGVKPYLSGGGRRVHFRADRMTISVPVQLSIEDGTCLKEFWAAKKESDESGEVSGRDRGDRDGSYISDLSRSDGCLSCIHLPKSSRDPIEKLFKWPSRPGQPNGWLLCPATPAAEGDADIASRIESDFGMSMDSFLQRSNRQHGHRTWDDGKNTSVSYSEKDTKKAMEMLYKGGRTVMTVTLTLEDDPRDV